MIDWVDLSYVNQIFKFYKIAPDPRSSFTYNAFALKPETETSSGFENPGKFRNSDILAEFGLLRNPHARLIDPLRSSDSVLFPVVF
jgi:hypothetical protein